MGAHAAMRHVGTGVQSCAGGAAGPRLPSARLLAGRHAGLRLMGATVALCVICHATLRRGLRGSEGREESAVRPILAVKFTAMDLFGGIAMPTRVARCYFSTP